MINRLNSSERFRTITVFVLLTHILSLSLFPQTGRAGYSGATDINDTTGECQAPECEDICAIFARNPSGAVSSTTWSAQDDTLCSVLGVKTSSDSTFSVLAANKKTSTVKDSKENTLCTIPDPVASALPKFAGQRTLTPELQCTWAANMKKHCQYAFINSPLESTCQAYTAIHGGAAPKDIDGTQYKGIRDVEILLLTLDLGAASLCATACAFPDPTLTQVCGVLALGESVVELIATASMKSSGVASYIQLGGSIIGGAGGAATVGLATVGKDAAKEAEEAKKAVDKAKDAADDAGKAGEKADKLEKAQRKVACATALFMAVLAGVRAYDLYQIDQAEDAACKAVKKYASGCSVSPSPVPNGSVNLGSGSSPGSGSGGGGGLGSAQGGGTATSASRDIASQMDECISQATAGGSDRASAANVCLAKNGEDISKATAQDARLLNQMGPPGAALSHIPSLADLVKKARSEGAGAALASILPPGTGEFGAAVANTAKAAQDDGGKLASALGISATYSSGGGGGGKSQGGGDSNPLASFFGGGSGGGLGAAATSGVATFGSPVNSSDIWHTNAQGNIFEIVSEKITRVSNRVK